MMLVPTEKVFMCSIPHLYFLALYLHIYITYICTYKTLKPTSTRGLKLQLCSVKIKAQDVRNF